jgi:hypothetical protein
MVEEMDGPPARVLFRIVEESLGKNFIKFIDYENDSTDILEGDIWITEIPLKCSFPTIARYIGKMGSLCRIFMKDDFIRVSVSMYANIPQIMILYRWNRCSKW